MAESEILFEELPQIIVLKGSVANSVWFWIFGFEYLLKVDEFANMIDIGQDFARQSLKFCSYFKDFGKLTRLYGENLHLFCSLVVTRSNIDRWIACKMLRYTVNS